MSHENAGLLRWPKPGLTTATAHQNPDKISGNRRDSDTFTTGPTRPISHQPSKDERTLSPKPSPWLATPTLTRYLGMMLIMSKALEAFL